jgi:hypothetical protein
MILKDRKKALPKPPKKIGKVLDGQLEEERNKIQDLLVIIDRHKKIEAEQLSRIRELEGERVDWNKFNIHQSVKYPIE